MPLKEIGDHKGIIYLPDESSRYQAARQNRQIKAYVRPLSAFVRDLKREVG